MSVYNGDSFLEVQVDSIMNQKGVEITLFIRDDGSKQKTISLLKKMQNRYGAERLIIEFGNNVGIGNSFMNALYSAPDNGDYYCFSDQDDIWLEDKIQNGIKLIQGRTSPTLYASDQIVVDENLKGKHYRFKVQPEIGLGQIMRGNKISGCTFIMNRSLYTLLKNHRPSAALLNNRIHDVWVAAVAAAFGTIVYDTKSYILYRQHSSNAVGALECDWKENFRVKWKYLRRKNTTPLIAKEILSVFDVENGTTRELLKNYSCYQTNYRSKRNVYRMKKSFMHRNERALDFALKLMLNKI